MPTKPRLLITYLRKEVRTNSTKLRVLDLLSDYFFITILLSHMVLRLKDLIPANLLAIVASCRCIYI